jgi:anti-sigma factor RsiW
MRIQRRRPGGHDITCQQAVGLVTDYLDGALSPAERDKFEAHLAECDACTEHVKQIRVTVAVTGHVAEDDLDPLAREDLMDLYRRWRDDDADGSP